MEKRPSSINALLAVRVAQSLDDRPSDGASARPRGETCRRGCRHRQDPHFSARQGVCPRSHDPIPEACLFEQFYRTLDRLPCVMAARHVTSIEPGRPQRRSTLTANVKAIHTERDHRRFPGKSTDPLIEAFRIPPNGTVDDVL